MLVRLFGKNFRSLKDNFELSAVAADLRREEDRNRGVIEVSIEGLDEPLPLLRVIALYGPNASGKSTILNAARALNWLAIESSASSRPDANIPSYEPFLLDEQTSKAQIELGCDVYYKNSLIRYEIVFESKAIQRESLTILNGEKKGTLIERRGSDKIVGRLIKQSKANSLYVEEMQPNVAVLSKLAQHGPSKGPHSVQPYYRAIRNATQTADYSAFMRRAIGYDYDRFVDDVEYREWIMHHLIRTADVGICDVQASRENVEFPDILKEIAKSDDRFKFPDKAVVISFVHEGKSRRSIEFSRESAGTQKLFDIAGDWWRLGNTSVTLLADELSASLHPRLLDGLIRAVNTSPAEGVQSQLIFTTHDTGLLESRDGMPSALRRDQVYFTKKDADGASELYSLAEFREDARPVHNIRKRYLSGQYGAIPSVEKLSL